MNIIYLGSFRFPKQDAASARVLCNAQILRALGHHVSFVSWGGDPREEDRINDQYNFDGFAYTNTHEIRKTKETIWGKIKGYISRGNKTLSLLKNHTNIDLIIAYNTPHHFNIKLSKYCKVENIFFAVDVTEWYDANEMGSCFSPIYLLSEWNMRKTIKGIPNKIVISHYLSNYYANSNNLLLPPLVNLKEPKWRLKLKNDINKQEGVKTFIYAGSPAKKDCLAIILNAFINIINQHRKTNFRFLILGVQENGSIHNFHQWDFVTKHKNNFKFLGRRPQDDIPAYYKISDFSIIVRESTRKNNAGFPTKAAESLSAGCPIICNPTSDLAEYIMDNDNGIILNGFDKKNVVEGLLKAMDISKIHLSSMKQEAKTTGERYFDYRNYLSPMSKWIESLTK